MNNFEYFSEKLKQVVNNSFDEARKMKHNYVGTEHLVLSIFKIRSDMVFKVKHGNGISYRELRDEIIRMVGMGKEAVIVEGFTPRAKECLDMSYSESIRLSSRYVEPEHLFLSIFEDYDSIATKAMENIGYSVFELKNEIIKELDRVDKEKNENKKAKKRTALEKYGVNLTELATKSVLDPLIGREVQIERVVQVLCRRSKNNPCIIGYPGVGKTAIVEGLAQRIVAGEVPDKLLGKKIVSINLGTILGGTKYRGEFEERLNSIINDVLKSGTIVFIDEIHTIVGAGGAEGAVDAANILKPLLTKGEFQVIGATTIKEYRKYIEKDSALERRFQPVMVDEPSIEASIEILKGLKVAFEKHHKIIITDEAIEKAVELSDRYIRDRKLPDKAIDIIDEAGAKLHVGGYGSRELTVDLVTEVISSLTGVPISSLNKNEKEKLRNLPADVRTFIKGQDNAVDLISRAIKRGRVGLTASDKPIGSFLFLGATGVGKTEMAKVISQLLFNGRDNFLKLDMSEYMEKHAISKLIGAPPGYQGYEDSGILVDKIRTNPYSVVLFDEMEKAHEDILNILLQILGEGTLTDSKGRDIDFSNSIVILTSNIGKSQVDRVGVVGFAQDKEETKKRYKDKITKVLKETIKPEILNRIDEIVIFNQLTKEDFRQIMGHYIVSFQQRLKQLNMTIELDQEVLDKIVRIGYSDEYGARELKRTFVNLVEDYVTELIVNEVLAEGQGIHLMLNAEGEIIEKSKN